MNIIFPILLITLLFIIPITAQSGLTFTPCTSSSACQSPRICSVSSTNPNCPSGSTTCRCVPPTGLTPCETPDDCPDNESCFSISALPLLTCISTTEGNKLGKEVGLGRRNGLTLDVCANDQDCSTNRTCLLLSSTNGVTSCGGRSRCTCLTPGPVRCSADIACDPGEKCAERAGLGFICISAAVVEEEGLTVSGTSPDNNVEETPDPASSSGSPSTHGGGQGTGLVLENCETTADCLPPRQCLDISGNPDVPCSEDATSQCVCGFLRIPICRSDNNCAPGEACVSRGGTGDAKFCISKAVLGASTNESVSTTTPTTTSPMASNTTTMVTTAIGGTSTDSVNGSVTGPNPTTTTVPGETETNEAAEAAEPAEGEGVCVDADLLGDFGTHELLFSEHRHGRVLCDEYGSCATRGHMVRWVGTAMMMKSYCAQVGCIEKVVRVNSPRYRKGLIVKSRSEGLVFTAFAARFATTFEEHVLRGIIRVGL